MQFLTYLAVLTPALLAGVEAKCVTSDWNARWPKDRTEAHNLVSRFCKSQLSGSFGKGGEKWACAPLSDSRVKAKTYASFMVKYTGSQKEQTLTEADCVLVLNNEVGACEHGGKSATLGAWEVS
ncbi:hypothetical protein DM02DRAFT_665552 [Periconia macrospinosa]|uniref:Ecp2 effector protein domain-containing protein n=1 Tax=Periconia macrospinosa TaxID=97972 RepID=A0A2V1CWJ5_9PLEO|nr:hypothetical protein DM02DRAFT_665552 [Periconia macrospinosa]